MYRVRHARQRLILAPTDHVKVVFPQPESGELVMPVLGERGLQPPEGKPRPIFRDYLRLELGLPRERVVVDGYWKRGLANLDHHSINLDED